MHIVWLNTYASFVGGCEQYIYHTASLLQKQGIRSTLLYDSRPDPDTQFLQVFDAGFPLAEPEKQLKSLQPDIIYIHQVPSEDILNDVVRSEAPAVRFLHDHHLLCLRKHQITTIGKNPCLKPTGPRCYACLGCFSRKKPHLRTLRTLKKERALNRQLDSLIAASHYMEEQLIANGFDESQIVINPLYTLETQKDTSIEREPDLLLFVGQLTTGKGIDLLLQAMQRLTLSTRLAIAGRGPQEAKYRRLVHTYHLDDRVSFLGHLSNTERDAWMQRAACVVMPHRRPEPFGLVGIEAMRFRTPVVAFDLGGVAEWLEHGKTGYLVSYGNGNGNVKGFASAVEAVLLGKIRADSAQEVFTPEKHVERLLEHFNCHITPHPQFPSSELEKRIENLSQEVSSIVQELVPPRHIKAFLMIGGYGKGEGGVVVVDGKERPHNDIDFLLITKRPVAEQELRQKLQAVSEKHGIRIVCSVIGEWKLRLSSPRIIWHEMIHGHKLLLGDDSFLYKLSSMRAERILPVDSTHLMMNRGALLMIDGDRHSRIKHIMKAIIGFGDALLFFLGEYHWSYRVRQNRMQKSKEISPFFRKLYDQAMCFRFHPNYALYLDKDLQAWVDSLMPRLSDIFLQCESIRLDDPTLSWDDYFDKALREFYHLEGPLVRDVIKKGLALSTPPPHALGSSLLPRLGFRLAGRRKQLAIAFPVVLFQKGSEQIRQQVARFLGAPNTHQQSLRKAFLVLWGQEGDRNFVTETTTQS